MEVVYRPDPLLPTPIAAGHLLQPDQDRQHLATSNIALHLPHYLSPVIYDQGKVGDLPMLLLHQVKYHL